MGQYFIFTILNMGNRGKLKTESQHKEIRHTNQRDVSQNWNGDENTVKPCLPNKNIVRHNI